ncbi:MAG TPA: ATP-binding cassette domain-containing protein, partial [Paracoccaceae bacterium]|nr:ATP-binding cassette domain-containing protein [Paracoccaceae bacterium]
MRLEDVSFAWRGRAAFRLDVPEFRVGQGERLLLLGPSGSGKSTLLSLVCGIVTPDAGLVEVDGVALGTLSSGARDRFRAERIGIIFQMFNLLPYASPLDNVLLGLRFAPGRRARLGARAREEALRLTGALGLEEEVVAHAL